MLWVLKEPSIWDGLFEHPKHMFKLIGENHNFTQKYFDFNWTYESCLIGKKHTKVGTGI